MDLTRNENPPESLLLHGGNIEQEAQNLGFFGNEEPPSISQWLGLPQDLQ